MLDTHTPFPHAGSMAFRRGTAEPVRIQRCNSDGSALVTRHRRIPGGGTSPLPGASANLTLPLAELFADSDAAAHGGAAQARRAARSRAAGRSIAR